MKQKAFSIIFKELSVIGNSLKQEAINLIADIIPIFKCFLNVLKSFRRKTEH